MKERLYLTICESERNHDKACDKVRVKSFFNGCVHVTETCAQGENVENVEDDVCESPHVGDSREFDVIDDSDGIAEEDE